MRLALSAGFAAAMLMGTFGSPPVAAKTYPQVKGLSCATAAKQVGGANVWHARFSGQKETLFGQIFYYAASPCFRTEADCKNWLYNTQTDYPLMMDFVPCRRGLR